METPDEDSITWSQAVTNPPGQFEQHRYTSRAATGGCAADSDVVSAGHGGFIHKSSKYFQDNIHGLIRLGGTSVQVMDTSQFQRMRELKQLGVSYYVFPSASHNRLEHSIGVAHQAQAVAHSIYRTQHDKLHMSKKDVGTVELAGLCHDMGHGPFSHVFEELLKQSGISGWTHEEMSVKVLKTIKEDLLEKHGDQLAEEILSDHQVQQVGALILAGHDEQLRGTQDLAAPLFDIVANGKNGIDVDRCDYLMRDSQATGTKVSCDYDRLMQFIKVIDDEICFKESNRTPVYELFHDRAMMFTKVYSHRKAKGIEYMVVDALKEANKAMKFLDIIYDPRKFVRLDDTILKTIENAATLGFSHCGPNQGALDSAAKLIERLRQRDLYQYVQEVTVPPERLDRGEWQPPTAADIITCGGSASQPLREEDVIIVESKVDFSMGRKNPMDVVKFFDDWDDETAFVGSSRPGHSLIPRYFQDRKLRIYSRRSDEKHVAALDEAFRKWNQRNIRQGLPASPYRPQDIRTTSSARKRRYEDDSCSLLPSFGQPPRQPEDGEIYLDLS